MKNYSIREAIKRAKGQLKMEKAVKMAMKDRRVIIFRGGAGLGKTYACEQIAESLGLAFVSKNMTMYTRPEMKGLPYTEATRCGKCEACLKGEECTESRNVTKFTMPEIINSTYEEMEKTGKKEGLLFIDEINTVAESIEPQMRDLLQFKKIGDVSLPEGWTIIAACNPAGEVNDQAKDFDDTLRSRVAVIEIEADFDSWRDDFAIPHNINPLVLGYLTANPSSFSVEFGANGGDEYSVNPRTWESLSNQINGYEKLINEDGVTEEDKKLFKDCLSEVTVNGGADAIIENRTIVESFSSFARVYEEYDDILEILDGKSEKTLGLLEIDRATAIAGQLVKQLDNLSAKKISSYDACRLMAKPIIEYRDGGKKADIVKVRDELQFKVDEYTRLSSTDVKRDFDKSVNIKTLNMLDDILKEKTKASLLNKAREHQNLCIKDKEELIDKLINVCGFIERTFDGYGEAKTLFVRMMVENIKLCAFALEMNVTEFNELIRTAIADNNRKEIDSLIKKQDELANKEI